jgi:hypothetical protein
VIRGAVARWRSDRLAAALLRLGCRFRSATLVALAWALASRPIAVGSTVGTAVTEGPVGDLLVLDKAGGTEDVLAAVSGRLALGQRVLTLSRLDVRVVFKAITGPDVFTRLTDSDYRPGDPELEEGKRRYREFLVRVLPRYRRWTGVTAITTANVRFRSERELADACTEVGVAFVPLHKESISTPGQRPWITRGLAELAGPFGGRAIAVYNADERDSIVRSGFAPAASVHVVGCPRMDILHRDRASATPPRVDAPVVLFAVDVHAGTWTPFDARLETGAPRWQRLASELEAAFIAAAREDPERPYLIKAKIGREDQQVTRLPAVLPANVEVVAGGLATDLIRRAAAVVGFNSTVLLEALAAGVPAVVPRFGEAAEADAREWTFQLGDAVRAVDDPRQLADVLRDAVAEGRSRELTAESAAALERYVGNSDGCAGERAWTFLSEATASARRTR